MEQGTGKTRTAIELFLMAREAGVVNAAVIVCPRAVRRQWVEQFAVHAPDVRPDHCIGVRWKNKEWLRWFEFLTKKYKPAPDRFPMLVVNYETFVSEIGKRAVRKFIDTHRCYFILDESQQIGSPGAKRTKAILAMAEYTPRRLIMTGTPIADSPFDFYSQMKFVTPTALEFRTYAEFKAHYGIFEDRKFGLREDVVKKLVAYRNLDELVARVDKHAFRVLKKDCLDLPPKVYKKVYVYLSKDQLRLHEGLREKNMQILLTMKAENPLERMIRMMQIVQNRARLVDGSFVPIVNDFDDPKMKALEEIIEELPRAEKVIIWSPHKHDIVRIAAALRLKGHSVVTYDGSTSDEDREKAKNSFQNGTTRFFVANQSAGGTGLDLWASSTAIYFANSRKLIERLQSEDRNHRVGTKKSVTYYDIIASKTIDEIAYASLMAKKDLSTALLDEREWLGEFQTIGEIDDEE